MKYSKRYIVFGVLVAAMQIFKLELGASGSGTVENFRGANLTGASFRGADLRSSCIAETNLLEIDLRGAKIDLEQAVLLAGALGGVYEP